MADFVHELEQAAQIILAPPQAVTHDQRHAAEEIILSFRKSNNSLSVCRHIFEHSKHDYVLFQAATTIKDTVVRNWKDLDKNEIESIRSFLLHFVTGKVSLQSYVREQVLQAVAVIFKRGTLDGKNRHQLMEDVTQMVASGNPQMQTIACSVLSALLNEFSSSARASDMGLNWEFHTTCKRNFETNDLKQIFMLAVQLLHQYSSLPDQQNPERKAVFSRFLNISEQILCWDFSNIRPARRNMIVSTDILIQFFKPDRSWRQTVLDKKLVEHFFQIHGLVRQYPELCHHAMQCLVQLASLSGGIFQTEEQRQTYFTGYIQCFLLMLSSIGDINSYEAVGLASIASRLIAVYPISLMVCLPPDLLSSFIRSLSTLTTYFGRQAALEEAMHKDDMLHQEAFDLLLDCWTTLVVDTHHFPKGYFRPYATEIYNCYLQCHLAAPDGTRNQTDTGCGDINEEEVNELEEDDHDLFGDQLSSIAFLGRACLEHSLHLNVKLLEDRIQRLHGQLQRVKSQATSGDALINVDNKLIIDLFEDIHWLVLISGYLIADDAKGETPLIPFEIMQYSIQETPNVNVETTLQVLGSPGHAVSSIPGSETSSDKVVRLIAAVFRLSEVERRAIEANLTHILSPQLGTTIVWFLKRWCRSYLVLNEKYYSHVSLPIVSAFGMDTAGAQWATSFLLEKVISNLSVWSSEGSLANDTINLFVTLVEKKERCAAVLSCNHFWTLVKHHLSCQPPLDVLSIDIKCNVMKALVLAGSMANDDGTKDRYRQEILQPLQEKFNSYVDEESFDANATNEPVMSDICFCLSLLKGVLQATRVDNVLHLHNYCFPFLSRCIGLVKVYQNYPEVIVLILEVYVELANRQLCYINETQSHKVYESSLSLLHTYSKFNLGKKSREVTVEDDRCESVSLLMDLLTNLLSKDLIGFENSDIDVIPTHPSSQVSAADIVLYGLNIVVPLMDLELLKFPDLCSQYYKLVTFICELYPEKVTVLSQDLFNSFMASLELGLTNFGGDVAKLCFDAIASLCVHCHGLEDRNNPLWGALHAIFKVVFNLLVLEPFDTELINCAAEALYGLICCHQTYYAELVNHLLSTQSDLVYYQRLAEAFNQLTPAGQPLSLDRAHKASFYKKLESFLSTVRLLMCVK
ncbi:exportin-4-like [Anneissia japonica]|uniref:exportin-4-like n=1 Tax=Anneissia japonica TaxID=1529436 RepID=UPI001425B3DF|nr:exportin-4-like [Anneissia japonica]